MAATGGARVGRAWVYLTLVIGSGAATAAWWTLTEEIAPGATEPGAYNLFLVVFTGGAMVASTLLCACYEVGYRVLRWRRSRRG